MIAIITIYFKRVNISLLLIRYHGLIVTEIMEKVDRIMNLDDKYDNNLVVTILLILIQYNVPFFKFYYNIRFSYDYYDDHRCSYVEILTKYFPVARTCGNMDWIRK